jgi:hypothetical protein
MAGPRVYGRWSKKLGRMVWYDPEAERKKELHFVQEDTIDPVVSHATAEGRVFDSRSKLMEHYKEHGYEVTGGDHLTGHGLNDGFNIGFDEAMTRDAVEKAVMDIKYDKVPFTEREKEACRREQRKLEQTARRMGIPYQHKRW